MSGRSFWRELRRRHVYRVAAAYAVVGWLLIEVATQVFPVFGVPAWSEKLVVLLILIGFPIALIIAWAFEVTPEGVRRTEPVDSPDARAPEQHRRVGRQLDFAIIAVLVVVVALLAWRPWATRNAPPKPSASVATASPKSAPEPSLTAPGSSPTANSGAPAPPVAAPPAATTVIPKKSIAVLPFENLSEDKKNGYFADGMQDLILTKLADIGELKVISRTSTAKYASHPDDLKTIAQQLGVANILEGSVQKAGNSVLINVQLIDARTDAHIWAQAYTRTLDNVFGVEGEVAAKIADALKAKLSPAETKRLATTLSSDPAANDLYLRADYYANRGLTNANNTALRRAIPLYRRALARVPDFALARARLSQVESLLAFWSGSEDVRQLDADARAQAQQAMDLAPDLAESRLAVGYCDYYGKSDYPAALKSFAASLRLRPNSADVYTARGAVLRRQGKFDESIEAFKHALTLDPRSSLVAGSLGQTYMSAGRYLEAGQALRHAIALDPGNDFAREHYADSVLFRTGDLDRALAALQGDGVRVKRTRVRLLTLKRDYRAALALLQSIPDTPDNFGRSSKDIRVANLYRWTGDAGKARTYYSRALPRLRARLSVVANHPVSVAASWNFIATAELGLGKTGEGIAAIKASLAASEKSGDHFTYPYFVVTAAARYAQAGRAKQAVSLLSRALDTPGIGTFYAPVELWMDPAWDSIRKSGPFQALLKKYTTDRPGRVINSALEKRPSSRAAQTAPESRHG